MNKREDKRGSITEIVDKATGEIRYWARAPRDETKKRRSLGVFDSREEATRRLEADLAIGDEFRSDGMPSWLKYAEGILDYREKSGVRGMRQERNRVKNHFVNAEWTRKPLDKVNTRDGAMWLRDMAVTKTKGRGKKRLLSELTIKRCLSFANVVFDAAGPQGEQRLGLNPFVGLEVQKRATAADTEEKWTFLTEAEQEWFARPRVTSHGYVREHERLFILFGAGTGARRGELFNLELRDLHCGDDEQEPRAVLRFGAEGLPRKNGKIHTVHLKGLALYAARAWLPRLATFCKHNFDRLVWPTSTGARRTDHPFGGGFRNVGSGGTHNAKRKRVKDGMGVLVWRDRFHEVLELAGITRRVRWYDATRHTCASSLVQGLWGDAWTMPEIKEQLDHSSIAVTERYAHLGENALKKATKKIRVGDVGGPLVMGPGPGPGVKTSEAAITNGSELLEGAPPAGIGPATFGLGKQSIIELLRALTRSEGPNNPLVTNLATTLAALLESERDTVDR